METNWLSLLPPLIVLGSAFFTKKIVPSLFLGIAAAILIVSRLNTEVAGSILYKRFVEQLDVSNIYIFTFLIALGVIITLLAFTGGTAAYSNIISKKIKSARSAETASILLSCLLLFDDFFSSITTGCIMRPLTDRVKVPRAKLAFLIDSMAAPLVILIPISSWIAMITMQLSKAEISLHAQDNPLILGDPFAIYTKIIPFILYSFIIITSVIFIVRRRISFGTMHKHEMIAKETGNLFGGKEPRSDIINCTSQTGTLWDFILPLAVLFIAVFTALIYSGGFFEGKSLIRSFQETDIFFSLCYGSLIALTFSFAYFLFRKKIKVSDVPSLIWQGVLMMGSSCVILFFAWMFSSLLINDLQSGAYLASIMSGSLPAALLPMLFFIISAIASIGIGSSWGTIAILVPLAVPMVVELYGVVTPALVSSVPILLPVLGAIFAGSVAGDHISPLSSTTLMSSTSGGAHHVDHVQTQLEYAASALIASAVGYTLAGFLISKGMLIALTASLGTGIILNLILLNVFSVIFKR